ncbi:hypothetical protein J3R82DRAFT_6613 [Butyriboletus roseoflavus]|nr:hypothetical protein J3R82DRAFT_6613 [Butyriboletus roseoflavus]
MGPVCLMSPPLIPFFFFLRLSRISRLLTVLSRFPNTLSPPGRILRCSHVQNILFTAMSISTLGSVKRSDPDSSVGPRGDFEIPTLKEFGLPLVTTSIRGGESEALRRLAAFCEDGERDATFLQPKTSPAAFDPPATTLLVRVRSRA